MPAESNESKPRWTFWVTVAVLSAIVLYPLSVGPYCFVSGILMQRGCVTADQFESITTTVYAPIIRVCDRAPAIGNMINPYAEFCLNLGERF